MKSERNIAISLPIENIVEDKGKTWKVWNGRSYSYLAKSQMDKVVLSEDRMMFYCSEWFKNLHPWLQESLQVHHFTLSY